MFEFEEYFDRKKERVRYDSQSEYHTDYMCLLTMLLDCAIHVKAKAGDRFYAPGTMMTDSQAEEYYISPPLTRCSSLYREDCADMVKKAMEHIRHREDATITGSGQCAEPVMDYIRKEFRLSLFEELAVLLPLEMALDINLRNIYAFLANDAALKYPTVGVLLTLYQILDPDASAALAEELCHGQGKMSTFFLDFGEFSDNKKSLMERPLILRPMMLSYLVGGKEPADLVSNIPYCEIYPYMADTINVFDDIINDLPLSDAPAVLYIESREQEDVWELLSKWANTDVVVLHANKLITSMEKKGLSDKADGYCASLSDMLIRLRLFSGTLCVSAPALGEPPKPVEKTSLSLLFSVLHRFLPGHPIFVCGQERMPEMFLSMALSAIAVRLPFPDVERRELLWRYYLGIDSSSLYEEKTISDIADCYELPYSRIRSIGTQADRIAKGKGKAHAGKQELSELLFSLSESEFQTLATHIPTSYTWDDLQIEPAQRKLLMEACQRFAHRNRIDKQLGIQRKAAYGNGVSVLLCGPPGTGKTMAAQVISRELNIPLYRIDVSQIFSKYIGETQKNLGELFSKAARTNVILFFDEADALFSKRTEVGDSHDKYANAETAYLLQLVEAYRGMTILATNLFANFDTAFVRRITYVVRLQKPDEATRLSLWKSVLPESVPLHEQVDFQFWADEFDLSGSSIKAVMLSAMYMSLTENVPLSNEHIAKALRNELEKASQVIDVGEFGVYAQYII